jgi:hypothetical protein
MGETEVEMRDVSLSRTRRFSLIRRLSVRNCRQIRMAQFGRGDGNVAAQQKCPDQPGIPNA